MPSQWQQYFRDQCEPCKSTCEVSTLSSHWTCIAIWFTFCAENLRTNQQVRIFINKLLVMSVTNEK